MTRLPIRLRSSSSLSAQIGINTDRTVTAFAARLRGETDIAVVRAGLLATINQTSNPPSSRSG